MRADFACWCRTSFVALHGWPAGPSVPIFSSNVWPNRIRCLLYRMSLERDCWGLKIISRRQCPGASFLTLAVWGLLGEGFCVPLHILYFSLYI